MSIQGVSDFRAMDNSFKKLKEEGGEVTGRNRETTARYCDRKRFH